MSSVTEQELRALAADIIDGLFRVNVPLRGLPQSLEIKFQWDGTAIIHTIVGIDISDDETQGSDDA